MCCELAPDVGQLIWCPVAAAGVPGPGAAGLAVGEGGFENPLGDEVRAWVRFREIAPGETKVILSYDNPAAESASDGEAAFLFFDDFESGFDGDKWQRSRDASRGGVGAFVRDGVMHVQGGGVSVQMLLPQEEAGEKRGPGFHMLGQGHALETLRRREYGAP